jgi:hypothetical protein
MAKSRQVRGGATVTAVNPFTEGTEEITRNEEADLLPEVDTPEALDDEVDLPTTSSSASAGEGVAPKPTKAPARPSVASGYITPVAFAKALTAHLVEQGKSNKAGPIHPQTNAVPPQFIYSVINQGRKPGAKNPLPTYSVEGRENLLILEEALAWWDAKDERVATSRAARADKAAKTADKAAKAASTSTASQGPVVEAE